MTNSHPVDAWEEGDPYELYVGRWSRRVAREFLKWLGMPPLVRWLDVGCGTGALSETIAEQCSPAELTGIDPSEGFLATARAQLQDRAAFKLGDALDLPLNDASVDVVVSGLVLNFVSDPVSGLVQMKRVARPRGTVAAYVWDYAGKMELMRYFWDAAVELNPGARNLDEGVRFPLCTPQSLEEVFRKVGLRDVGVTAIDINTQFGNFDDYWTPFLGGQGPAPTYAMSLDDASRGRLRELIRKRLPMQPDGSIPLIARAWAVRGTVPT
jgi:SAM-dependent methyltransferase